MIVAQFQRNDRCNPIRAIVEIRRRFICPVPLGLAVLSVRGACDAEMNTLPCSKDVPFTCGLGSLRVCQCLLIFSGPRAPPRNRVQGHTC
jgi:hypothetical protein